MQRELRHDAVAGGAAGEARAPGRNPLGGERDGGRRILWGKVLLIAGLAIAPAAAGAGCDTASPPVTADADSEAAQDAEEEADAEAADAVEEDGGESEREDAGPDSDVPDAVEDEASDSPDGMDLDDAAPDSDFAEEDGEEAEDAGDAPDEAGCVETRREGLTETAQPDVGDPSSGGSVQTQIAHDLTIEYSGEECDGRIGSSGLNQVEYRFSPPLADFMASVKMGIITSNLADAPVYKVMGRDATGCIATARIVAGERIGMGMPVTEVSDGAYLVVFSTAGETSGAKWVDISIWDLRRGTWVRDERVEEGGLFTLPNGNRGMPTGIDLPGHTVRMDILEPTDYPLCDGARVVRESDGIRFIVQESLPEGWSFFVER